MKKAPASGTCGLIAQNPTAKSRSTTAHSTKVAGKAAPFPAPTPSGMVPAMTVSGAAAATTMKTMEPTPRVPDRRVAGAGADSVGAAMATPGNRRKGADENVAGHVCGGVPVGSTPR